MRIYLGQFYNYCIHKKAVCCVNQTQILSHCYYAYTGNEIKYLKIFEYILL